MDKSTYENKQAHKATLIHKTCKGSVKRTPGGLLWCLKCNTHVNAVECRYSEDK